MSDKIQSPEKLYIDDRAFEDDTFIREGWYGLATIAMSPNLISAKGGPEEYTRSDIAEAEAKKKVVEVLENVKQMESFRSDTNNPFLTNYIDQLLTEYNQPSEGTQK
jgi:hypothetical protein